MGAVKGKSDKKHKHQIEVSAYSIARKIARKKYGCKCAMCGEYHEHISLHHVFGKSKYPQYANEPNNLIALCWKHHEAFHKTYEGTMNVDIYHLTDYMCNFANTNPEYEQAIKNVVENLFDELTPIINEIGGM